MASSSSKKSLEKQQQKSATTTRAPSHKSLPYEATEWLKNNQNWGEKFWLTYDEEKTRRVFEIQQNMDINDLLSYVMYGDGEEVVWNDDVWNLQGMSPIVTEQREAKEPNKDNIVAEKPLGNGNH